mgnify:CR=1 FL=1|tara:strand:+ start:831 stop:1265 length:435 start_codon:yes stop_codon:yes gene_type:complete
MDSDFDFDMTLDDNGVLIFRFSGVFDVDKWAERQRAATARIFPQGRDPMVPAVTDLRDFIPPPGDWTKIAKLVFGKMDTLGDAQQRCALITGGNPGIKIACRFYILSRTAVFRRKGETRDFSDFDEGYAWAAGALTDSVPTVVH